LINTGDFGTPTARTMIGNNKSKIGIKGGARAGGRRRRRTRRTSIYSYLWLHSLIQGTSYLCTQRLALKRYLVRKDVNWFGQ